MPNLFRPVLAVLLAGLLAPAVCGHFNILLPQTASARKGDTVAFVYQFGHPFEHELFDAPPPAHLIVIAPDGEKTQLAKTLEKIKVPPGDKKEVTAYRFRFTPQQRGDYTFILETPPIWMEEDKHFIEDTVKVVLHVQAQKGWDADVEGFRIVPLTRPYGLQPGMVFQAQLFGGLGKGLPRALVEIERFNPAPPAKLPPDEHITRTARTDPNGVVTTTLPEAGWWSITGHADGGRRERNGKMYPVRARATLWVWVDGKATGK
ncbi:MAG TPA: DUF4198 domain-containing protein [Gemmataceae bacterium]|nr:DUF4198 domain-containing protein [Gemmataceae bacterium]